jgi:hypothetical protein
MHCDLKKSRRNEKVEKKDSLAYSSSWTYGIPQATTTLSKAISF